MGDRDFACAHWRRARHVAFVEVYLSLDNCASEYVHSVTLRPPHGSFTLYPQYLSALASASLCSHWLNIFRPLGL